MKFLHEAQFVLTLFLGGVLTSAAESIFKYSLYDFLKEKISSLFHKKSAQ